MICGDIPMLEARNDGSILVLPTPWNGKERIRGKTPTLLGGIVLLEQSGENAMEPMMPAESALPVFMQFAVRPSTEEQIRQMEALENQILAVCQVWKLKNRGDMESSRLASEIFTKYLEGSRNEV